MSSHRALADPPDRLHFLVGRAVLRWILDAWDASRRSTAPRRANGDGVGTGRRIRRIAAGGRGVSSYVLPSPGCVMKRPAGGWITTVKASREAA